MRLRDALELLLLAALFGASFLYMRIAAPEFGAYPLAAARVALAALVLLPVVIVRHESRQLIRNGKALVMAGLFNSAVPFACFSYAATVLPVGVSSLLNATTPLWGAIVAWVWLHDRPLPTRAAGLAIGFTGALVLFWTPLPASSPGNLHLAALAALAAPLSYGIAASFTQRYLSHTSALVNSAGSLIGASLLLAVPAWLNWPTQPISWQSWLSVILLAVLSTAFAYILLFRLIGRIGPVRAVTVTYLVPLFGITWGALLLGEPVTSQMVLAGAIILLGTALATGMLPRRRRPLSTSDASRPDRPADGD